MALNLNDIEQLAKECGKETADMSQKLNSLKVLPIVISGYNIETVGDSYYHPTYTKINISAIGGDFYEMPDLKDECCLVFGAAKLIEQKLLDSDLSEEFKEAVSNFENQDELKKQIEKLKKELENLDKKKKYFLQIEAENQALKHQNDLIKQENDAIKAEIDKYNNNPPEGASRFNLLEVD